MGFEFHLSVAKRKVRKKIHTHRALSHPSNPTASKHFKKISKETGGFANFSYKIAFLSEISESAMHELKSS